MCYVADCRDKGILMDFHCNVLVNYLSACRHIGIFDDIGLLAFSYFFNYLSDSRSM